MKGYKAKRKTQYNFYILKSLTDPTSIISTLKILILLSKICLYNAYKTLRFYSI